jgi:hypothetical protein
VKALPSGESSVRYDPVAYIIFAAIPLEVMSRGKMTRNEKMDSLSFILDLLRSENIPGYFVSGIRDSWSVVKPKTLLDPRL